MLRNVVQAFAVLFFVCSLALVVVQPMAWPALLWTGLLLLGTFWERFYYRGNATAVVGTGWQPTEERFLDEESGGLVTVWFNAGTGERRYVEHGEAPPA